MATVTASKKPTSLEFALTNLSTAENSACGGVCRSHVSTSRCGTGRRTQFFTFAAESTSGFGGAAQSSSNRKLALRKQMSSRKADEFETLTRRGRRRADE
jgi:ribosomal protein L32